LRRGTKQDNTVKLNNKTKMNKFCN